MKNLFIPLITAIFTFAFPLHISAQVKTATMTGRVSNESGKGMQGVNIIVKSGNQTFGATSGRNGLYEIGFAKTDTITATFSYVGYGEYSATLPGDGHIKRDVTLRRMSIMLDEVEVSQQTVSAEKGNVKFIPTKRQKDGAMNGISLLYNLMIPQIDVNPVTGEVKAVDRTALTFCIDGREVGLQEISRLRPKDVAYVEYDDHPTGLFAGRDKVVNYVTRKYDSGGYVDARTNTHVLFGQGDYSVQGSFDKGNVNLLAVAGSSFGGDDTAGSGSTESYNLTPAFTKTSVTDKTESRSLADFGLLQATVRGKRSTFTARAQLAWNETPKGVTEETVKYSPSVYPASNAVTDIYQRAIAPQLYLYHNIRLNDRQNFYWNLTYDYARNVYRRSYAESTLQPVTSNAKENYHMLDLKLNYAITVGKSDRFSLLVWNGYTNSRTDYYGTSGSRQRLDTYDFLIYPTYTHYFGRKFMMSLQLGFDVNTYKVNDEKRVTKLWPRPRLNGNIQTSGSSNIAFNVMMGTVSPQLSMLNGAEQYISSYEVMRGNPGLATGKLIQGNVSYGKYMRNVRLGAYVFYKGVIDQARNWYMAEGGKLVRTYITDGDYHSYTLGLSGMLMLLGNSLQLKVDAGLNNIDMTGSLRHSLHTPVLQTAVYYATGHFSFSGYYNTPRKGLDPQTGFLKTKCDYGLTAAWGNKGLFVQIGCRRIFGGKDDVRSYYGYADYSFNRHTLSRTSGQAAFVNVSYSFDFGRKVKRESVNINKGAASGILKP